MLMFETAQVIASAVRILLPSLQPHKVSPYIPISIIDVSQLESLGFLSPVVQECGLFLA